MKKGKKKKLRKSIKSFLVLLIFVILASYMGWYLQRSESLKNRKITVEYKTVNTRKTTDISMVMVGDALIHGTVYQTAYKYGNYNTIKRL